MKRLLSSLLVLALCAACPLSAEAKGKGKGKRAGKANPAVVLKRFDKNGNGVIDEAEVPRVQKAFNKGRPALQQLDTDKDGKLSSGEIFAVQKAKKKRGKKK